VVAALQCAGEARQLAHDMMTLANKEMLEKCAGEAGKAVHKAEMAGMRAAETKKQ
jgi:hypothetical protein